MGLSAAEKARRYRQNIKSDPERYKQYLEKEKARYKERKEAGKIKTIHNADSKREKRKMRRNWKVKKADQRQRKRNFELATVSATPPQSPDPEEINQRPNAINSRSLSARSRIRKDRAKAYRTIQKLEEVISVKNREVQRLRKNAYRLRVNLKSNSPRSKVESMLKGQNVSKDVRKTLVFHNALINDAKDLYRHRKSKRTLAQLLKGRLLRKYRLVQMVSETLGASRKMSENKEKRQSAKSSKFSTLKRLVLLYYNRDDISCIKAGKKETITRNKVKKQKRLLKDSLKNIHLKFMMEEKAVSISYSLFCRLRPFWVLPPSVNDRDTCQCKVHANAQFMADILKKWDALPISNIEKLVEDTHCDPKSKLCWYGDCDQCKNKLFPSLAYDPGQQVQWYQWADRVEAREIGKGDGKQTKPVKRTFKDEQFGTLGQLRDDFQLRRNKLSKHIYNIRHQYSVLRSLRENQPEHSAIIHMDFSENYLCKFNTEIQSVHFGGSHQHVSLHTGIAYLPSSMSTFCTLSDCTRHDPAAIWAHLTPVIRFLQESDPGIDTLHFVSDGPTTQYRCRKNFYMFCTGIYDIYGIKTSSWNFLEAGHGKGPADGVGAVIKRKADSLVAQNKDLPNAQAVFDAINSSDIGVKTWFVTEKEISAFDEKFPDDIPAVPGTMKLHQVMTESFGKISYRDVSCFCGADQFCGCYQPTSVVLQKRETSANPETTSTVGHTKSGESVIQKVSDLTEDMEGSWCLVEYDGLPYPGVIQNVDDGEAEVKVMHRIGNNRFFWPSLLDDIIWYPQEKILTLMPPVEPVTTRHQQVRPDIWRAVSELLGI